MDEFPRTPNPLRVCTRCRLLAPAREGGCCICRGSAPLPSIVYDYMTPHPDPVLEARVVDRSGPAPRGSIEGWLAHRARLRIRYEGPDRVHQSLLTRLLTAAREGDDETLKSAAAALRTVLNLRA
jgi:hypothetical protein